MDLKTLRRSWYAPLIFFQIYLSLTLFLFFYGPWPWDISNPIALVTYLLSAQLSIGVGFLAAWPQVRRAYAQRKPEDTTVAIKEGLRFTRQALLVTFIILIPTSLSRTGSLLPDVAAGLRDTGAVYNANVERLGGGNAFVLAEYVRMALAPWLVAVFPLTVVYWEKMSAGLRGGCMAAVLANLSLYMATGTNKGLADILVTGPWLIYLATATGLLRLRISLGRKLLVFCTLFLGFLQFFANGQVQRAGGVGEGGVLNTGTGVLEADTGILGALISDNFRIIFESMTRYVCSGYYALSLSMEVEHGSTWGLGHSMFLARNADAIFGTNFFSVQSLPALVESQFGWSKTALWHSIYPWLASDFGFTGSVAVIGLLAYLLSLSWGMSLSTLGYRWITMLFLMLILFFYIPANNQIFQSGETCIGFFLVLGGLMLAKSRRHTRARHVAVLVP